MRKRQHIHVKRKCVKKYDFIDELNKMMA